MSCALRHYCRRHLTCFNLTHLWNQWHCRHHCRCRRRFQHYHCHTSAFVNLKINMRLIFGGARLSADRMRRHHEAVVRARASHNTKCIKQLKRKHSISMEMSIGIRRSEMWLRCIELEYGHRTCWNIVNALTLITSGVWLHFMHFSERWECARVFHAWSDKLSHTNNRIAFWTRNVWQFDSSYDYSKPKRTTVNDWRVEIGQWAGSLGTPNQSFRVQCFVASDTDIIEVSIDFFDLYQYSYKCISRERENQKAKQIVQYSKG